MQMLDWAGDAIIVGTLLCGPGGLGRHWRLVSRRALARLQQGGWLSVGYPETPSLGLKCGTTSAHA